MLLDDQDRSLWDAGEIDEGRRVLGRALALRRPGPVPGAGSDRRAPHPRDTDWAQIAQLYERLLVYIPSPVVELNRAVAVAFADGPEHGLELLDSISGLDDYHLFHATRADLLRRLERNAAAADAYRAALELVTNEAERRFLSGRLREVSAEA